MKFLKSSHVELLAQLHMKESYLVTLSCLRDQKSLKGVVQGLTLMVSQKNRGLTCRPCMGNDGKHHNGCQVLKLYGSEINQVFK
jgi:hypothetical protein